MTAPFGFEARSTLMALARLCAADTAYERAARSLVGDYASALCPNAVDVFLDQLVPLVISEDMDGAAAVLDVLQGKQRVA